MQKRCRTFVSDQQGIAAVEFAFIAAPLFAILFGIAQLSIVFFSNELLDMGVRRAARLVLTGQAQQDSWAPPADGQLPLAAKIEKFRSEVCTHARILLNCNDIKFDVRVLSSFNQSVPSIPITNGEINDSGLGFSLGGRNEIVLIRAMYLLPTYSDILGSALINAGTNKRLIISSALFVNEPF